MAITINVAGRRLLVSEAVLMLFYCVFVVIAGYLVFYVFQIEIDARASGQQSDYVLDGYYYLKLAGDALQIARGGEISLHDASIYVQPNQSSGGIVFLSAILLSLVSNVWLFPFVLLVLILAVSVYAFNAGVFRWGVFLVPVGGMFPYMPIPSKELFVLVGLILFLVGALSRGGLFAFVPVGLLILFFARTEALLIFLLSGGVLLSRKSKVALLSIGVASVLLYLHFREYLVAASALMQYQAERVDLLFCSVGPLNLCVGDGGGVELIYIIRFVTLLVLPFKWIFDFLMIFWDSALGLTDWVIRGFSVLQIFVLYLVWREFRQSRVAPADERFLRNWLLLFALIYWFIYATVFYFQPSRQALLCLSFVVIALTLKSRRVHAGM